MRINFGLFHDSDVISVKDSIREKKGHDVPVLFYSAVSVELNH